MIQVLMNEKTKLMIEDLPVCGGYVAVHNSESREEVSQLIHDLRGREFLAMCQVCIVKGHDDLIQFHGSRVPILIADGVLEAIPPDVSLELQQIAASVGAIYRMNNKKPAVSPIEEEDHSSGQSPYHQLDP